MFCSKNIFVYSILIMSILFLGLYIWRRISCVRCYAEILEKKVVNLKKENKELHNMLSCNKDGKCSVKNMKEADELMSKIFMDSPNTEIVNVTNVSKESDVLNEIIADVVGKVPVASDLTVSSVPSDPADPADPLDPAEIESVVSDAMHTRKKLTKMNLDKLKDICNGLNISTDGTKNMLIDRILAQEQK